MNLSVKTMPWMAASILAATSIFGQHQNQNQGSCMPQPPPVCKPAPRCGPLQAPQQPMNCAYNAPAEINIGIQDDIDFFASGSFIYWQPSQDGMEVAFSNTTTVVGLVGLPEQSIKGSWIEMNFKYKPGFKAGLGMNLQRDDWDGYAEYTRIHGTHSTSSNGPTAAPNIFANWGAPFTFDFTMAGGVYNSVYASYRNNLDFADVEMGRTYYVGKSLIFRSAWGARAAWILQNIHVNYANTGLTRLVDSTGIITARPGFLNVYERLHSWAVGPRAGLTMDWMLGCGIRFFGSGYGDILYTKYKIQNKTVAISTISVDSMLSGQPFSIITRDKVGLLRSHLDLEWGLGWGSYFDNNNWHIDLSASYGYQVFFNQNMFRQYLLIEDTNSTSNGNLYVQGLTATARLDF